jgi:8-oxo-dGTP pyrophosphatase MutT (NUDIX family)
LVVNRHNRVLLFKSVGLSDIPVLWVPPGGGLEPGESYEAAAIRELVEELGLVDAVLDACVWDRRITFRWPQGLIDSRERFYVCRVTEHDLAGHVNPDEIERSLTLEHRWWSVAELAASQEIFVPRDLAGLLPPIIRGEYPATPVQLDA